MIVAYVKGQELNVTQPIIVADTIDYLTASFAFKTADWNGLQKWAHFKHGESVYDVLLTDDKIEKNAHLNLSAGEWELYLHGTAVENGVAVERITTEIATLTVKPTGALNGEVLPDVPPSAAEQIFAAAQEAINVANSVRDDADSGAFDGRDGQDGRDGVDGRNGVDGADAKINGYNTVNIVAGENVEIEQSDNTLTISSTGGGGGGGTSDHRQLSNRDAANQHPINAITGLQSALDGKQPVGDYATTQDVSDLADIVDTKADASDIPSLDGYATETYVNNHHDATKQDALTAGENISIVDNVISAAGGGGGDEWELINEVTIPAGATEANRFSFTQDFDGQPIRLKKAMVLYYYPKYEGSSTPPGYCFASVNNNTSTLAYTTGFTVPSKAQNRSGYYSVEIGGYGLPYNECVQMTETGGARRAIGSSGRNGVLKCYCTNGTEPAQNEITEIGATGTLVYEGCYFALYGVRK